jgi:hypothetical protein
VKPFYLSSETVLPIKPFYRSNATCAATSRRSASPPRAPWTGATAASPPRGATAGRLPQGVARSERSALFLRLAPWWGSFGGGGDGAQSLPWKNILIEKYPCKPFKPLFSSPLKPFEALSIPLKPFEALLKPFEALPRALSSPFTSPSKPFQEPFEALSSLLNNAASHPYLFPSLFLPSLTRRAARCTRSGAPRWGLYKFISVDP